ncbi:Alpha/Beta hydrolase protein [Macrophomina phaseolina]|uniref:Alpha/Beta hydrolase protein n=1 Tax=Macrophomina phaseolina TaxID=35725 RepID=A0ABQ8GQ03_9PEZI|nr:Alpha/Beta hydrolase protein [Macrophomina phaseolina]
MALQGYVVVAPDYAGLGVGSSSSISSPFSEELSKIIHPYLSSFSHANDLLYSIRAAQSAFPSLSRSFVTIGHSQGGAATWALATLDNSSTPLPGHARPTSPSSPPPARSNSSPGPYLAYGIHASFPAATAPLSAFLTPAAQRRWDLFTAVGGSSSSVASALFPSSARTPWLLASTATYPAALSVASSSDYSLCELGAPLLVLQGLADPVVLPEYTQRSVHAACAAAAQKGSSGAAVEYVEFEGTTHMPVMAW